MDLLANDFDPDGDELQLTVHTLPRYGRLVRTRPGGGVLVYTPSPGIGSTTDSFRCVAGFVVGANAGRALPVATMYSSTRSQHRA